MYSFFLVLETLKQSSYLLSMAFSIDVISLQISHNQRLRFLNQDLVVGVIMLK